MQIRLELQRRRWVSPLLARRVLKRRVELLARVHTTQLALDSTGLLDFRQELLNAFHRDAERRNREDHAMVPCVSKRLRWNDLCLSELRHVREEKRTPVRKALHRVAELFEVFERMKPFWKDHISTSIDVSSCASYRIIESTNADRDLHSDDSRGNGCQQPSCHR